MTPIELTDVQRQSLQNCSEPIDFVDPATQRRYVLLAQEQYERVRTMLEPAVTSDSIKVPEGILRSQQAYWRDLPELLKNKRNLGKWVCYHGDEQIGIASTTRELIQECLRRNLKDDEYDMDVIEPRAQPPWEPIIFDPGGNEVREVILYDETKSLGTPSP